MFFLWYNFEKLFMNVVKFRHIGIGLLAFVLPLLVANCTKNDVTTIIPVGTESYVQDILSVIPDSAMVQFNAAFGAVPEGYIPPKIEGRFVIGPKQRVASNVIGWPLVMPEPEPNATLWFFDQHNGVAGMEFSEALEQQTDTVYVMGSGNDFTAYVIESKSYDMAYSENTYHVDLKRGIVVKGSMTAEGIRNLYFAVVIMEVNDDSDGLIPQYEPGSYFIYKDGDGIASRLDSEGGGR